MTPPTTLYTPDQFAALLASHLDARDGAAVAALLPQDPLDRFGAGFNLHMDRVDADDIGAAYGGPLLVVADRVADGKVPSVPALFKLLDGVQWRVGLKLGAKAARRANPRVRPRRRPGDAGPIPAARPLLAPAAEPDLLAGVGGDPAAGLLRRELFLAMLAESRGMGRLPARAFREVTAAARRRGTLYGAFRAVARRAVLDAGGTITAIRPEDPGAAAGGETAARTVKQVRLLYGAAARYLSDRVFWTGPGGL